jgi:putative PIN family toxin of toxin-antitoxin system
VRAVVDFNVLISAVLSSRGASAELLRTFRGGEFELIISELLLAELKRALAYPMLRKHIPAEEAAAFISWVRGSETIAEDPTGSPPVRSPDPDDDYLLSLAIGRRAFLVTGDQHLLGLSDELPIYRPADFLRKLGQST